MNTVVAVVVSFRYCCYCLELLMVSRLLLLLLPGGPSVVLRTSKPQQNNYCWIMNPSSKFSFLINDGSTTDHTQNSTFARMKNGLVRFELSCMQPQALKAHRSSKLKPKRKSDLSAQLIWYSYRGRHSCICEA